MFSIGELRAALEALLSDSADDEQRQVLREAVDSGELSLATGERAVAVGGSADGAVVLTGNENVVLSVDRAGARSVQAALAGLYPSRLRQLPPDLADFEGRAAEVERLVSLLDGGGGHAGITAIDGMPGVGKSVLAVHVAHRLAARYPDGQLVVELAGTLAQPLSPEDAMSRVIRSFEPAARLPEALEDLTGIYRSLLSQQRALVLLDNARDADQVRDLLPPPPSAAIVTSRRNLVLPGLQAVNLDVLSEAEAEHLLRSILGPERAESRDLSEIADLCGRLPLALRVAGSFLAMHRDWTVGEYRAALQDERQRLNRLRVAGDRELDVAASLSLSEARLAEEQPALAARWQLLTVFPESFEREAVAQVWEVSSEEARDGLGALLTRSMVLFDAERRRYRLHDLMRDVARGDYLADGEDLAERPCRIAEAAGRHAKHYIGVLDRAEALYLRGGDYVMAGLRLFDLEQRNFEAGQGWSATHAEDHETAARLCGAYSGAGAHVLSLRQPPREQVAWLDVALAASRRLGDRGGEANALGNLGNAHVALGETRRAIDLYEKVLEIAREIGDRRVEATSLGNLGIAYKDLGETRRAIDLYEKVLEIAREIGDRRGEGNALGNLGNAYAALGEARRAIEFHEQNREIAHEIGDRRGEGNALGNLGVAYTNLGEADRAIELYEQRLEMAREIGDRQGEGNALFNMAIALDRLDRRQEAIGKMQAGLELYRAIEAPDAKDAESILMEWRKES